jgi:hypothetical protein
MTIEQLRPAGSYRDPTGPARQQYWDAQTWRAKAPPTIPAPCKLKTWIKGIAMIAAALLAGAVGTDYGGTIRPSATEPGNEPDPQDETEPSAVNNRVLLLVAR